MKKQNVRTLALIVCAFTYLLIGAAIFDALESRNEAEEKRQLAAEEAGFKAAFNISDDDFERLRRIMIKSKHYKGAVQWKFAGSFYFALTVFTTIGYGHSTPKTLGGKLFCIAYALGGIPLGLVMFQSIGERFNLLITCIIARAKRCVRARQHEATQSELIAVACTLCCVVLAAGAAAFSHFEGWRFEDAFYYCFITLATIGFGDYVALQEDHALQRRPEYVAFSVLYILFGLTVFAAALNLLVLRLLTMNTEDERKDELQALATARSSVRLDGDVITAAASARCGPLDMEIEAALDAGDGAPLKCRGGGSRDGDSCGDSGDYGCAERGSDGLPRGAHSSPAVAAAAPLPRPEVTAVRSDPAASVRSGDLRDGCNGGCGDGQGSRACCGGGGGGTCCYTFGSLSDEEECASPRAGAYDVTLSASQTMHLLPSKGGAAVAAATATLGNGGCANSSPMFGRRGTLCTAVDNGAFKCGVSEGARAGKRLSV